MSAGYKAVLWNKYKKQYDIFLWVGIIFYLAVFIGLNSRLFPYHNFNTILIRAFGTLAILLLHVVLVTGPLCRLNPKFLPLLYNRRHLGVSMFLVASVHALICLLWFHGSGNVNPLVSLFSSNIHYNSFIFFPFQTLGFIAWIILLFMAVTSHDFWLNFLTPKFWKILHMLVYFAYFLLILHVALGIIQYENSPVLFGLLLMGVCIVSGLHLVAAVKENKFDSLKNIIDSDGWEYVCTIDDIDDNLAKMAIIGGERIAVFKYDGKLSAVHNVCKHQMGPLGEGKVVDGCITCPWHGYQYRPEDGCAPAPFTEKLHTYRLRLDGEKIFINVSPLPEGSFIEPLKISAQKTGFTLKPFFIGWSGTNLKAATKLVFKFGVGAMFSILLLAVIFTVSQHKISRFQMDYNHIKKVEGWLTNTPVPVLQTISGKDINGNPIYKTILLVDGLKHGANELVATALNGNNEAYVKIEGYATDRQYISCGPSDSATPMCSGGGGAGIPNYPIMEIADGLSSITPVQAPIALPKQVTQFGKNVALTGEIIDPKCYFGAMNPGEGKPHRSCAIRCISGGVMPCFKYSLNGQQHYAILVGKNGEVMNKAVLPFVGEPVKIIGNLQQLNNWEIFYASDKIQQAK